MVDEGDEGNEERASAADEQAAAVRRSSVYLNGLPCFLLDAHRSRSAQLPSPAVAVAAIKRLVGGAASSGEELPVELFDDLLVSGSPRLTLTASPAPL
jgi:hypothetical protein